MGEVRLSLPRVRVIREGHEPLDLQVKNPDLLRWEDTARKHKWPSFRDGYSSHWLTFIAWAAARRTGATADTWETWRDTVDEVTNMDDDDDGEGEGDPFPPGPDTD